MDGRSEDDRQPVRVTDKRSAYNEAAGASGDAPAEEALAQTEAPATTPEADVARERIAELEDSLLRERADFANYRQRVARDRELAQGEASRRVVQRLLPVH